MGSKKKRIVLTQFYVTIKMSMDNFVSQGEARERATRSCNARIKAVAAVRQPISRRA
jgi:hypothetical protein